MQPAASASKTRHVVDTSENVQVQKKKSHGGSTISLLLVATVFVHVATFVAMTFYTDRRLADLDLRMTALQSVGSPQQVEVARKTCRHEIGQTLKQFIDVTSLPEDETARHSLRMRIDKWMTAVDSSEGKRHKRQTATNDMEGIFDEIAKQQVAIFEKYCGNASKICTPGPQGMKGDRGQSGVKGHTGQTGQPGPPGKKGDRGPQGEHGASGVQGQKGQTGLTGTPGKNGPPGQKGDRGPQGEHGASGLQGQKGQTGQTGTPGKNGPPGQKGPQGRPGTPGEPGVEGLQGPMGPRGEKGENGPRGTPGVKGHTGDKGTQGQPGISGKHGLQGPKGALGPMGEKGEKGPRGTDGVKGHKGDKGTPGQPGLKGEPGMPGSKGEFGPTGEKGAMGPRGAPGLEGHKGDNGTQGQPGTPGEPGLQGSKGALGPMGEKGEKGPRGTDGVKGHKGDKGTPGIFGSKGSPGPTGMKGEKGVSGTAGPRGPPGLTGDAGRRGDKGSTGARGEKGLSGKKGERGMPGTPGPTGNTGSVGQKGDRGERGAQGQKGDKGLPGLAGAKGQKGEGGGGGGGGGGGSAPSGQNCCTALKKPTVDEPRKNHRIKEDQTVTLTCGVQGYPPAEVTWEPSGLLHDPRVQVKGHDLLIRRVRPLDSGVVSCTATNALGSSRKDFQLRVLQHLIIANKPKNITVQKDFPFRLECNFTTQPPPNVTWYHVTNDGTREEVTSGEAQEVVRPKARLQDEGLYVCQATDGLETVSYAQHVLVLSRARITQSSGPAVVARAGDDLDLFCRSSSHPSPTIRWIHDRNDSHVYEDESGNGDLHLVDLRPQDGGNYTCTASNFLGNDSRVISLEVQVPPVANLQPTFTPLRPSLLFDCVVYGDPPVQVTWLKNDVTLNMTHTAKYTELPDTGAGLHRLLISPTDAADIGIYTCLAVNRHGNHSDTAWVSPVWAWEWSGIAWSLSDCTTKGTDLICRAHCPDNCQNTAAPVYGSTFYSQKSAVCRSAVHAGVMKATEAGVVVWVNAAQDDQFVSTSKHGVTSQTSATDKLASTPVGTDGGF